MSNFKKVILYIIMFLLIGLGCKFCFDFYIGMSFKLAIIFCVLEGTNFITFTSSIASFRKRKYVYSLIFMMIFIFSLISSVVSISGSYYNITGEAEKKQEKKVESEKYKSLDQKIKDNTILIAEKKEELKKIEENEQFELKATNGNFTNTLTSIRSNYLKLKENKNNEINKLDDIVQTDKNNLAGINKYEVVKQNLFEGNNAFFTEISKVLGIKESNFVLIFSILSALFFNLIIICIKITCENMDAELQENLRNNSKKVQIEKVQKVQTEKVQDLESAKSANLEKVQVEKSANKKVQSAKVQVEKSAKVQKVQNFETINKAIFEDYQKSANIESAIEKSAKVQVLESAKSAKSAKVQNEEKCKSASLEKVQKVQSAKNVKVQNEVFEYYTCRRQQDSTLKDKEIIIEIIEKFGISERTFKTIKSKLKAD